MQFHTTNGILRQELLTNLSNVCCILPFGQLTGVWIFETLRCSILHHLWRWNRQSVPKRRHIKFRRRGITQKKEFSI